MSIGNRKVVRRQGRQESRLTCSPVKPHLVARTGRSSLPVAAVTSSAPDAGNRIRDDSEGSLSVGPSRFYDGPLICRQDRRYNRQPHDAGKTDVRRGVRTAQLDVRAAMHGRPHGTDSLRERARSRAGLAALTRRRLDEDRRGSSAHAASRAPAFRTRADQEIFGELCVYHRGGNERISQIVRRAEDLSRRTASSAAITACSTYSTRSGFGRFARPAHSSARPNATSASALR